MWLVVVLNTRTPEYPNTIITRIRSVDMNPLFRRVAMFKYVLTAALGLVTAFLISGCSHRSLAAALHAHESFDEGAPSSQSTDASTFDKTVSATGVRTVKVGVGVGSAKITAEGSDGIKVHAVRKYSGNPDSAARKLISECRVDINTSGSTVEIKDFVPEALKNENKVKNLRLEMEVRVPAGLSVESDIGVGGTSLDGRFASIKVGSGVGDVVLKGESGSAEIGEGVGVVHANDLRCTGDRLSVHSGTGDIDLALSQTPRGELKVDTGVGKIAVAVPADARANANLSTGVGSCKSDFPLNSPKRAIGDVSERMDGQINGGGAPITLKSGVGEVTLKKR